MKLNISTLLSRGKNCDCCGMKLSGNAYTSAGINGGIYCSVTCVNAGPKRLLDFKESVAAELQRRGVKFLPLQCFRALL